MQTSTKQKSYWVITVLFINFAIASLIQQHVQDPIDTKIYDDHNQYLVEVKSKLHETLGSCNVTEWQDLSFTLENQFDAESNIIYRDKNSLGADIFEQLQLDQSVQGMIDIEQAVVYYPLNDEFVFSIGPVPYYNWLVFVSDWMPWLIAILINLILLQSYLRFRDRINSKIFSKLANGPMPISNPKNFSQSVSELKDYVEEAYKSSEERVNLQRDLLHGVAHEFRSPMARIQFALDMQPDADPEEAKSLQLSIQNSLDDLDDLVKELLYYARLKDENSVFKFEPITINEAVTTALEKVTDFYPKVTFTCQIDQTLYVRGELNLLTRLFVNLLRNAGRFAVSQCIISAYQQNGYVIVDIEDDGIGIPPGKKERVFEPFTRLDPSRSRDSGGCGLGLAIVASIATKHHGKVKVLGHDEHSQKLAGACFRVQLPIDADQ